MEVILKKELKKEKPKDKNEIYKNWLRKVASLSEKHNIHLSVGISILEDFKNWENLIVDDLNEFIKNYLNE